jgi:uncharacterized protein
MKAFSVVTGASNGIGLELARKLAARGHDLVLVSRDESKLRKAASDIGAAHPGVTIHVFAADLSAPAAAQRLFAHTAQLGVEVDVLINNAGVGLYGEHAELEPDALVRMLQLNVVSLCELCGLYGREMKRRGRGRILNVASTAAYQPTPFFAAYGASKAFVLNFSEALAKELEDHGVTVSCLSPGPTDTGFFGDIDRRGIHTGYFAKGSREDAATVAQIGLDAMFSGRLSRIVGVGNYWTAWAQRFAPRSVVASMAKSLMRASSAKPARAEQAPSGQ